MKLSIVRLPHSSVECRFVDILRQGAVGMDALIRTAEARGWPTKESEPETAAGQVVREQLAPAAEADARTYLDARPRQRELLGQSVAGAFERTFFYGRLFRKHFRGKQMTPELVRELFFGLPFTSKEDVVRNYPNGFLAVAPQAPVAYFESSGTSGNTIHSTR